MTAFDTLLSLGGELNEAPRFPVEAPDGKRGWTELDRQAVFRQIMRNAAPAVLVYAVPNAGKRNPAQARKEGIMGGVFDLQCWWRDRAPTEHNLVPFGTGFAAPEMKGYDSRGRAGRLSQAQIDWGNRMHDMGWPVACFFDPYAAVDWIRSLGAPVRALA